MVTDVNSSPKLQCKSYKQIKAAMTGERWQHGALAATHVDDDHIRRGFPGLARGVYDQTLTSQLKYLLSQDDRPELYLFTAMSAIPVADAFRGFFGNNRPALGSIKADRVSALSHIDRSRYYQPSYEELMAHRTEVERMRELTRTVSHVCVVEQFSASGNTLRYAGLLLREAGVETVSGIRGQWYNEAAKEHINEHELTSSHAPFMHSVGALVREQLSDHLAEIRT